MSTLVYFASGPYKPIYENLPFDKVYLIDKIEYASVPIISEKVIFLKMDALEAIDYFKMNGITIDCFVSINEGLVEGGGPYAIHSDSFFGYAMPVFNDPLLHIFSPAYYAHTNKRRISLDFPFTIKNIFEGDADYINPNQFSRTYGSSAVVRQLYFNPQSTFSSRLNGRLINFINDTIWRKSYYLDTRIIPFIVPGKERYFINMPGVINERIENFSKILQYCNNINIRKIGLTPWNKGNYDSILKAIQSWVEIYPLEISFFHLNKDDYQSFKISLKNISIQTV